MALSVYLLAEQLKKCRQIGINFGGEGRVISRVVFARGGRHVLVTEFRGIARNGLFCADVLRPHDRVPLTD